MKTAYAPIINEEAYLNKEEERELMTTAIMIAEERKLSSKERDEFFNGLPALRDFAESLVDILGVEKYKEMEADNIRLIKEKAWKNEFSKI